MSARDMQRCPSADRRSSPDRHRGREGTSSNSPIRSRSPISSSRPSFSSNRTSSPSSSPQLTLSRSPHQSRWAGNDAPERQQQSNSRGFRRLSLDSALPMSQLRDLPLAAGIEPCDSTSGIKAACVSTGRTFDVEHQVQVSKGLKIKSKVMILLSNIDNILGEQIFRPLLHLLYEDRDVVKAAERLTTLPSYPNWKTEFTCFGMFAFLPFLSIRI
jgi:hypothetical protein